MAVHLVLKDRSGAGSHRLWRACAASWFWLRANVGRLGRFTFFLKHRPSSHTAATRTPMRLTMSRVAPPAKRSEQTHRCRWHVDRVFRCQEHRLLDTTGWPHPRPSHGHHQIDSLGRQRSPTTSAAARVAGSRAAAALGFRRAVGSGIECFALEALSRGNQPPGAGLETGRHPNMKAGRDRAARMSQLAPAT
jgi:hypothetical protein